MFSNKACCFFIFVWGSFDLLENEIGRVKLRSSSSFSIKNPLKFPPVNRDLGARIFAIYKDHRASKKSPYWAKINAANSKLYICVKKKTLALFDVCKIRSDSKVRFSATLLN